MNKKEIKLIDMNKREYVVHNKKRFLNHINEYHKSGSSIHEVNGFYFLVDEKFRLLIKELLK